MCRKVCRLAEQNMRSIKTSKTNFSKQTSWILKFDSWNQTDKQIPRWAGFISTLFRWMQPCDQHIPANTSSWLLLLPLCRNPKCSQPLLRCSNGAQGSVPLHQLPEARGGVSSPGSPHVPTKVQVSACHTLVTFHWWSYQLSWLWWL